MLSYDTIEEMGMYLLFQTLAKCNTGVRNQKKKRKPAATLASAHHGVTRGEPMNAIWAQSNVMSDMPIPW